MAVDLTPGDLALGLSAVECTSGHTEFERTFDDPSVNGRTFIIAWVGHQYGRVLTRVVGRDIKYCAGCFRKIEPPAVEEPRIARVRRPVRERIEA